MCMDVSFQVICLGCQMEGSSGFLEGLVYWINGTSETDMAIVYQGPMGFHTMQRLIQKLNWISMA